MIVFLFFFGNNRSLVVFGIFLLCMGLISVAWEKLNMCLSFNMWEKRAFRSPFVLFDRLCS